MAKINGNGVQAKMLDVLSDGKSHAVEELHACLNDDLGPIDNVCAHITHLKKVLNPQGKDILMTKALGYRAYILVRIVASSQR